MQLDVIDEFNKKNAANPLKIYGKKTTISILNIFDQTKDIIEIVINIAKTFQPRPNFVLLYLETKSLQEV